MSVGAIVAEGIAIHRLAALTRLRGVILDLRGNGGGAPGEVARLLGAFSHGRPWSYDCDPAGGTANGTDGTVPLLHLPLVVLTHLHADHVGGLDAVLADHSVGAVGVGPAREPDWAWKEVRAKAAKAGVPLVELDAGRRLDWPGLSMEVLAPGSRDAMPAKGAEGTEINNSSVVLRATTPAGRILLSGDVELAAQAHLLNARVDMSADVLKVPHHGSRYTTPELFGHAWQALQSKLTDQGKPPDTFPNALATMWCYITDDRAEADRILRDRVIPTVHRPEQMLRDRLPIGPPDAFAEKLTDFAKAGVQRVFIWPVADELGIRRVVFPESASTLSAYGILHSNLAHDLVRSKVLAAAPANLATLAAMADCMLQEAQARLEHAGGYNWRDRALQTLHGLGSHDDSDLDRIYASAA